MRKSGVLLPVTSLSSKYGIGSFSKEAYQFIDDLVEAGQSCWQILPLGPTGYGDSPYQSFSTFAGNPYFIDLEELIKSGYLTEKDCEYPLEDLTKNQESEEGFNKLNEDNTVHYEAIYLTRFKILKKAYQNSDISKDKDFQAFLLENNQWLEDYSLYMAIKNDNDDKNWTEWEENIKMRKPEALDVAKLKFQVEIECYQFQQYIFHQQWCQLKKYANERGIEIVGDIPIYVALDSSDAWANPELFQFDENCHPIAVAGCPPDAFSVTGQLWGNPLYEWDYHKKTNYEWWVRRISCCIQLYDIIRVDHFRGFDEYYSIPFGNETAEVGTWEKGPGYDIFRTLKEQLGDLNIIAEDLGYLTESVLELVEKTGYPGMKILQFAFDSREESDYLPHNYIKNCIAYTGTHDNDTVIGWYQKISLEDRNFTDLYLNKSETEGIQWPLIRVALASVADTVIIPMQDYLGLDSEARTNTPSTVGCNWVWRMKKNAFTEELKNKMQTLSKLYSRI